MKKRVFIYISGLTFFISLFISSSIVKAQSNNLIAFNFFEQTDWGTQDLQPTTIAAHVTSPTGISRVGKVITPTINPITSTKNRWGGISFAGGAIEPTTNLRYFTISIQANAGYVLNLDSISSIKFLMSGFSANYFAIKYSLDNGATFNNITTHTITPKPTSTSNQLIPTTDLTGISALKNVKGKVVFMILPYNGSNNAGNNYNFIQFGNFAKKTGTSSAAVVGNAISIMGTVKGNQ
jgi:hypothetical protein